MKKLKFLAGLFLAFGILLFLPTLQAKAYTLHTSADKIWRYEILTADTIELQGINNSQFIDTYGSISNVTFPDTVDGYKVTSISLFQYGLSKDAHTVTIPEGITEIKSYFLGHSGINKMLQTINLPASLIKIGNQAFNKCTSLSNINFAPNPQLKTIGMLAFQDSTSLNFFDFTQFKNLTNIENSAFEGSFIQEVDIGDNVSIDYNAFGECSALASVTIGNNCKLEHYVFSNSHSLKSAVFGNGCYLSHNIFTGCENLSSLDLGSIKALDLNLFDTKKIKKLTIPKSCTAMPNTYRDLVPKNVVLYVDKGSVAENYAKKAGYKYEYISGSTTTTKVGKVSSLKVAKASISSIKVSWKKVSGANGYEVYMKTNSGSYKKISTIKKISTASYTAKKLKKNKTYTFKVRAYKNASRKPVYGSYSSTKKLKLK